MSLNPVPCWLCSMSSPEMPANLATAQHSCLGIKHDLPLTCGFCVQQLSELHSARYAACCEKILTPLPCERLADVSRLNRTAMMELAMPCSIFTSSPSAMRPSAVLRTDLCLLRFDVAFCFVLQHIYESSPIPDYHKDIGCGSLLYCKCILSAGMSVWDRIESIAAGGLLLVC